MSYQLPLYPSNRLETLIHTHTLARPILDQQTRPQSRIIGAMIPCDHISHTGSMTMAALQYIYTATLTKHIIIIYDPTVLQSDSSLDTHHNTITTTFGHHIAINHTLGSIPTRVDELCCIIQLYTTITSISLYTIQESIPVSEHPIIRIGSHLQGDGALEENLVIDEQILTNLVLKELPQSSQNIVGYHLLSSLLSYYHQQYQQYHIIPISYHNTGLIDGNKIHTKSYCSALITL